MVASTHSDVNGPRGPLIIACGALANEILSVIRLNNLDQLNLTCLPAKFHNTPEKIPEAMREKIRKARTEGYGPIFAGFADCGTGGLLDKVLEEEAVERIGGPHCYSFYSGNDRFAAAADEDVTSFFLTDFLCRHFDRLIIQGLGIDRHPQLLEIYFGNYRKLVYLSQLKDSSLTEKARAAAVRLNLDFEERFTGYGDLETFIRQAGEHGRK